MKLKYFVLAFSLLFLGAGCTDMVVEGTSNKISNNGQITAKNVSTKNNEDLFKKKQECASYRSDIEKQIKEGDFQNEINTVNNFLDELWFSPAYNTCMYSTRELNRYTESGKVEVDWSYSIYDYLGSKMWAHYRVVPDSVTQIEADSDFDKHKEELKK